jgi:hypothetical protein
VRAHVGSGPFLLPEAAIQPCVVRADSRNVPMSLHTAGAERNGARRPVYGRDSNACVLGADAQQPICNLSPEVGRLDRSFPQNSCSPDLISTLALGNAGLQPASDNHQLRIKEKLYEKNRHWSSNRGHARIPGHRRPVRQFEGRLLSHGALLQERCLLPQSQQIGSQQSAGLRIGCGGRHNHAPSAVCDCNGFASACEAVSSQFGPGR